MEEFGPVVCAIDLGGTKFEVGLVTLDGVLIDRERGEVDPDVGPQSHLAMLAALVSSQLVRAREHHRRQVLAIGIGCAGPIEPNCATVSPVNIASWNRFPLQGHLEELTGLRVFGDLDAKALYRMSGATTRGPFIPIEHAMKRGWRANVTLFRQLYRFARNRIHFFHGMNGLFRAFYESIQHDTESPTPPGEIVRVTKIMDDVFETCLEREKGR